jgi:hypothetical protein
MINEYLVNAAFIAPIISTSILSPSIILSDGLAPVFSKA